MEYSEKLKEIGEHIKEAREEKGYTQNQLIAAIQSKYPEASLSRLQLSALENGKTRNKRVNLQTLYAIGEILNVDVDYLLGHQEHTSLTVQDVSRITGLSPKAIECLQSFEVKMNERIPLFLDAIIGADNLGFMAFEFENYLIAKAAYDERHVSYLKEKEAWDRRYTEIERDLSSLYEDEFEFSSEKPDKTLWIERQKQKIEDSPYTKKVHYSGLQRTLRQMENQFIAQVGNFLDGVETNVITGGIDNGEEGSEQRRFDLEKG